MNNNKTTIFMISVIMVMLILLLMSIYNYSSYKTTLNKYNLLEKDYNVLLEKNTQLDCDFTKLSQDFIDLNNVKIKLFAENKEKDSQIDTLSRNYNSMQVDYETFKDEVDVFKNEIEDSMDWFNTNSSLDSVTDSDRIKSHLETCVTCEGDTCKIRTACINVFVNIKKLNITYSNDKEVTGNTDKLQSLDEFIIHKKGDCEDYSLLFAAELRYLIDYVKEDKGKTPVIETLIEADTTKDYFIYGDWYYTEGLQPLVLDKDYLYPYVACGQLYDPEKQASGGHCEVLITNKEVTSVLDLDKFNEGYLLEPQTGFLNNNYKVANHGVLGTDAPEDIIFSVITDNDYYMHESRLFNNGNYESNNWYSFGYYLDKINNLE